ncbi:methionyl-tRNA synthetase [Rhizomicrobium palustre]|uniref:Methionine--tRNA ligase n=1 Tax=Rhizomicrobium palustre TaxID=189966 RepID=A0A846N3A1_9PROT|nr:methionine--tRNA ligase [Rhizomicrobium palustre]NIK89751.1 methionyl-tRNA synthetase [Rhizomicrobium palustre]
MTRYLITSALPYINGVKHLGNLVGSMLPADVYARFRRAKGDETLFICATDEHGTPAELAALEAGQDVATYCTEQHEIQKSLGEGFALSFDYFGRSSSVQNRELTQHLARVLWANGHLEVRTTKQVYSHAEKRFLPDRYVVGTCPHCGYERARGDQCENCTRVLDPADLINPRSAISGSTEIEIRDSKHLFLKQSAFVEQLRVWIESHAQDWPNAVLSIARKWLDEGLNDRGITRDLSWGVPVPDDIANGELKGKVFYVWFDAPIEYIGATKELTDSLGKPDSDWQRWWRPENPKDVTYVEFMGKDNVPFHTVGFPVTVMGSGENWKLVDRIKGFNWMNYYGGKFSTSQKRGIFMDKALEILPADYWRWWLMANAPESADSSFTWEHFASVVNKDLADVLGNFVNRVTKFTVSRFEGKVPGEGEYGEDEKALIAELDKRVAQYNAYLEDIEFRKALGELRAIWVAGNEYLTKAAPWTHVKTDRIKAAVGVRMGLNLVHLFGHLTWPVLPASAKKIHEAIQPAPQIIPWPDKPMVEFLDDLEPGQAITPPDVMFAKITDEQLAEWKTRFGGQEA